ncbi:MAG: hypothetical protein LBC35_02925 [Coriobacteriales bacterium]|jgi:hypothetical protein|nr:hypothetical protein [Coriobacteriales bacterium]
MTETLNTIAIVCFVIAALCLIAAVFWFFTRRIINVRNELSGRTAAREIAKIRSRSGKRRQVAAGTGKRRSVTAGTGKRRPTPARAVSDVLPDGSIPAAIHSEASDKTPSKAFSEAKTTVEPTPSEAKTTVEPAPSERFSEAKTTVEPAPGDQKQESRQTAASEAKTTVAQIEPPEDEKHGEKLHARTASEAKTIVELPKRRTSKGDAQ